MNKKIPRKYYYEGQTNNNTSRAFHASSKEAVYIHCNENGIAIRNLEMVPLAWLQKIGYSKDKIKEI